MISSIEHFRASGWQTAIGSTVGGLTACALLSNRGDQCAFGFLTECSSTAFDLVGAFIQSSATEPTSKFESAVVFTMTGKGIKVVDTGQRAQQGIVDLGLFSPQARRQLGENTNATARRLPPEQPFYIRKRRTLPFLLLDPQASRRDLAEYAARHGVNLNELIEGARRHFTSGEIVHRTQPFSESELESLFEDDQRAFGG